MLFPQPLLNALARSPDLTAFAHGAHQVSYGQLLRTTRRMATGMREAGLGRGTGVAMVLSLTPEAYAAQLAAHALGCRVAGVRPGWTPQQLANVLAAGVDAIVTDPASMTPALACGPALLDAGDLAQAPDGPLYAGGRPDDIARLNFTSGSTGLPKACARTYRTFSLAYQPEAWPPGLTRIMAGFSRFLAFATFASPVVMTFTGRTLITGGTVVIPAPSTHELAPRALERHGITGAACTPPTLRKVLDAHLDLRALQALVISGSPADPSLLAEAADRLGPVVWQAYGQSEAGMIALLTPEDLRLAPDSVGRPLPGVEVSVRSPDGRTLPAGETGRIHVRSPHAMSGYLTPEEDVLSRDGWLDTQDLGHLGDGGFLYLTGRAREVIMINGQLRYAGPIERALAAHPEVDQALVVGAPDLLTGEAIHAFIVACPDCDPDVFVLRAWVSDRLGVSSTPRTITLIPAIPLAPSGKPDKHALLAQLTRP